MPRRAHCVFHQAFHVPGHSDHAQQFQCPEGLIVYFTLEQLYALGCELNEKGWFQCPEGLIVYFTLRTEST